MADILADDFFKLIFLIENIYCFDQILLRYIT